MTTSGPATPRVPPPDTPPTPTAAARQTAASTRAPVPLGGAGSALLRHPVPEAAAAAGVDLARVPYTARILLENALHAVACGQAGPELVDAVTTWSVTGRAEADLPFLPHRVVLQDFSGVPVVLDLAALRTAAVRRGLPPQSVQPVLPADLVVDHSVRVDAAGTAEALRINAGQEYARNGERYALLRWAEQAFPALRVVPPGTGIIHQVNLERLAPVVAVTDAPGGGRLARPDTVLGTDSHTPMIGGLGVLGWGVGGIEATSVLLGEPVLMRPPRVVGVRVTGAPAPGTTATDLVLALTRRLRRLGVVGAILEFHGPGVARLSVPDRATLANMAPDYGATTSIFPVDEETLRFLRATGRPVAQVELVERYCRAQGLFRPGADDDGPAYAEQVEFDLGRVEPGVAGPRRPDQWLPLRAVPGSLPASPGREPGRPAPSPTGAAGRGGPLPDGAVVIAALTSCTNTSHPGSMIAAGLVARRAVQRGLTVPSWVKTSLAPGSRTVPAYLDRAGLLAPLEKLGFHPVAFGCTTCHGMSGPLTEEAARAVTEDGLTGVAVLSGNRNFEGRIHPQVGAAYLASPALVVCYALAGTAGRDLTTEPVATAPDGRPVMLADLWPAPEEIEEAVRTAVTPDLFEDAYGDLTAGDERWRALDAPQGLQYPWTTTSDYLLEPPFLGPDRPAPVGDSVTGARILALLGDAVSTDHISPVGAIPPDGDAGRYLRDLGVPESRFNSFGARRGNHEVMVRGAFASPRLRNAAAGGREGPWARHLPSGEVASLHSVAERYRAEGVPLVVVAGREYGCGSARDWAAKGTALLGVRAVLAESFERIHRSNLVGMGVLPLVLPAGADADRLGLDGSEEIDLLGLDLLRPRGPVAVRVRRPDGPAVEFEATAAVETDREVAYVRSGGILPFVAERLDSPAPQVG
ncbi:aconitate hydratase AcnA [Streptomyces sp. NPDC059740]|uniref:aconitate hydratase AcnA n=1 Tax=Streptomyces sp. NPDC059740 TaxID=3346926 RepID=UPI003666FE63